MGRRYEHMWESHHFHSTAWRLPEDDGWELVSAQHTGEHRIYYWKRPVGDK